jgi:hypothetical protein
MNYRTFLLRITDVAIPTEAEAVAGSGSSIGKPRSRDDVQNPTSGIIINLFEFGCNAVATTLRAKSVSEAKRPSCLYGPR